MKKFRDCFKINTVKKYLKENKIKTIFYIISITFIIYSKGTNDIKPCETVVNHNYIYYFKCDSTTFATLSKH